MRRQTDMDMEGGRECETQNQRVSYDMMKI